MDNKAQSSLEYLLLIAGVVLVAAIVIVTMMNSLAAPANAEHRYNEEYNKLYHSQ